METGIQQELKYLFPPTEFCSLSKNSNTICLKEYLVFVVSGFFSSFVVVADVVLFPFYLLFCFVCLFVLFL